MIHAFFSSARMILLECHESLACCLELLLAISVFPVHCLCLKVLLVAMVGENRRLVISWWISRHGRSKFPTIGWQSDPKFNPPAISRCTRKCPGNVVDSSCELLDFNRKKYTNIGRYPGNGNQYPPGHEHGYLSAGGIEGCTSWLWRWTATCFAKDINSSNLKFWTCLS